MSAAMEALREVIEDRGHGSLPRDGTASRPVDRRRTSDGSAATGRHAPSEIVARSGHMHLVVAMAKRLAPLGTPVLITGESGTGKELLAQLIHARSPRSGRPMVSLNCAALPDTLMESELFGYRRGAFTGAQTDKAGLVASAEGGTLFLDEIAELTLLLQAKLLRFLEDGVYFPLGATRPSRSDVRIIAATNADLAKRVDTGVFRRDLYFRLSVIPIYIRPLRARPQDILPLVHYFLQNLTMEVGKRVPGISQEAMEFVISQPWPGNVRELRNAIERAVIVSDGNLLTSADFRPLEPDAEPAPLSDVFGELPEDGIDLPSLNRRFVTAALKRTDGNVSAAARLLGMTRPALRYRIKKYGLHRLSV